MAPSLMDRMLGWSKRLAVRGFIGQLKSPFVNERVKATGDLRAHIATDERVVPALLRTLADDPDGLGRMAAAEALGHLAGEPVDAAVLRRAIDGLVEAFRVDSVYTVRVQCAQMLHALGWMPADLAERAASAAMRNDLDALRAIGRDGHRDVMLAAVARELTDGNDPRMLPFIREVGAGSAVMVGAVERFVHQREQGQGVATGLAALGIGDPEFLSAAAEGDNVKLQEARAVLAALRASVAAPSDGAHGTLRRVNGHSLFYKCPSCGVTLRKRDVEGIPTALGWTTCSECAASFSYADVYYHGKYDIPEVEGACFVCGASLRGPETELAGRPCPSCGVPLPTVAAER